MTARSVRFSLSERPLSDAERGALADDLRTLGADEALLDAYSATVSGRGQLTQPCFLRAEAGEDLLGLAVVFLCRDSGVSFFPDSTARRAIQTLPPIWYWERASLGTDGHAGPGIVAAGVDREKFRRAAVSWLSRRFAMGSLIDGPDDECDIPYVPWPGLGVSTLEVTPETPGRLVEEHRNLSRKLRKFSARGGTVDRVNGSMPKGLRPTLMAGYRQHRPNNPPFREMYPLMVTQQWEIASTSVYHLIARVHGDVVGYHTFLHTGERLALLSGVFDRHESGNTHAYENVLVDSVALALDVGATKIDYGGTVNEVKASLLTTSPSTLKFVSRIAPLRYGLGRLLPHTSLGAWGAPAS